jgi:hypothetical protein
VTTRIDVRCGHAWTLRYWVNGKQVEKSFQDKKRPTTGRVDYGSGKKLAQDWQLKHTVDKRSGDITFADHAKTGRQNFGEACEQFIARMRVNGNTRILYEPRVPYLRAPALRGEDPGPGGTGPRRRHRAPDDDDEAPE